MSVSITSPAADGQRYGKVERAWPWFWRCCMVVNAFSLARQYGKKTCHVCTASSPFLPPEFPKHVSDGKAVLGLPPKKLLPINIQSQTFVGSRRRGFSGHIGVC